MAIAYDNGVFYDNAGWTTTPPAQSLAVGSGSDRVLLVFVGYYDRTQSVTAITYGGVALTLRRRYENGSAAATQEVWRLIAPASGTADIAVTMSGSSTNGIHIYGMAFTGVDQTTPIEADNPDATTVVTGSHTEHDTTITTVSTDAWLASGFLAGSADRTADSGQTERSDGASGAAFTNGPMGAAGSKAEECSFPSFGAATNYMAVALAPAAGASFQAAWARGANQFTGGGMVA